MLNKNMALAAFEAFFGFLGVVLLAFAGWAVVPSGGYIWEATTTKGVSLVSFIGTLGLTAMLFIGLLMLYRFGHRVLPFLPKAKRQTIMPIFVAGLLGTSAISVGTSVPFIAEAPAIQAELGETLDEATLGVNRVIAAQELGQSAELMLNSTKAQLVASYEAEDGGGDFCLTNRPGRGPCTAILQSLIVSVNTAQSAITSSKSRSAPLIERLRATQETARRALENDRLSYEEKKDVIDEQLALMVTLMRQLQGNMPIQAIEAASLSLSQEWNALGIPAVAAARLSNMLNETASSLRLMLDDLREVRAEIPSLDQKSSFEVIAAQFDDVWPLVLLAACPDGLSLIMLTVFFLAFRRDDDETEPEAASGSDTGSGPSNLSRVRPVSGAARQRQPTGLTTYH